MKLKKVVVSYFEHNHHSFNLVSEELRKNEISFKSVKREKISKKILENADLVITVGGDGTFLRTSHHLVKTPILAVSSGARYNEAFFSRASRNDFSHKLKLILQGRFRMAKLARLQVSINGRKIPLLAVNEVFIGNKLPYHTSRYELDIGNHSEFQKSSGILITTKKGSTGWAKSAAKKKLSIPNGGFGYVVRESYSGRLTKPTLVYGSLSGEKKIRIKSRDYNGIVVVDSYEKEFSFLDGDRLEVGVSKLPLNFIEF